MNPGIVEMDSFNIVGLSCETTMEEKDRKVPELVMNFHSAQMKKIRNRINAPKSFGMFVDPPNWNPETEPFTWIAGVEVTDLDHVPERMTGKTIPAEKYAVLEYHPLTDKINPYQFLHRWIRNAGYKQISNYGFEVYNPFTGKDTGYSLHLPVR